MIGAGVARYAARRAVQLVVVLLAASVLLFVALRIVPGDPAERALGRRATPEALAAKRAELGVDRPLVVQYLDWIAGIPTGDLGASYTDGQPVTELVTRGLAITVQVSVGALLLAVLVAVPLGMLAAARPGGLIDAAVTAVAVVTASVPQFIWAMVLILTIPLGLGMLPASGYVPWSDSPGGAVESLVLPVVALGLPSVGILARATRVSMLETFDEPFFRFSRSKGLSRRRLHAVHGLKRAAVPVVTIAGTEYVAILAGTLVIETVFALPGIGKLLIDGFVQRDYALIQGVALVFTAIVVVSSALADAASAALDPRIRRREALR